MSHSGSVAKIFGKVSATQSDIQVGFDGTNLTSAPLSNTVAPTSALDGAVTVTIAQLLTGVLSGDPGADIAWTLPTAALAVAGVSGAVVGTTFDFYVVNLGTTTVDEAITVTAGANGTVIGNGVVSNDNVIGEVNSGSAKFRMRFTNVTSTTETYDVYRLA